MNQTAVFLNHTTLYWYSVILALSVLVGVCLFMACCSKRRIPFACAARTVLLSLVLSMLLSRMIYWYCRPLGFDSLGQALTVRAVGSNALSGAFAGCMIAAILLHTTAGGTANLLDCMSVAGCGAIALGRLAFFFTDADRGQIVSGLTQLPWVYPVVNPTSGLPEYRFAAFVFQAAAAGILFVYLFCSFFMQKRKKGSITLLFLLAYTIPQILLDSTRYDALCLRSNGFLKTEQVAAAVTLLVTVGWISVRAIRVHGMRRKYAICWSILAAFSAGAGYMEYYIQRHGRQALLGYSIMGICLAGVLVIGWMLWRESNLLPEKRTPGKNVY